MKVEVENCAFFCSYWVVSKISHFTPGCNNWIFWNLEFSIFMIFPSLENIHYNYWKFKINRISKYRIHRSTVKWESFEGDTEEFVFETISSSTFTQEPGFTPVRAKKPRWPHSKSWNPLLSKILNLSIDNLEFSIMENIQNIHHNYSKFKIIEI